MFSTAIVPDGLAGESVSEGTDSAVLSGRRVRERFGTRANCAFRDGTLSVACSLPSSPRHPNCAPYRWFFSVMGTMQYDLLEIQGQYTATARGDGMRIVRNNDPGHPVRP
jgi:hypothetical protein